LRKLFLKAILAISGVLALGVAVSFGFAHYQLSHPADRTLDVKPREFALAAAVPTEAYFEIDTGGDQGCPFLSRCVKPGLVLVATFGKTKLKQLFYSGSCGTEDPRVSMSCDNGREFQLRMQEGRVTVEENGQEVLAIRLIAEKHFIEGR
jgi:hypothetical protein